MGPRASTGTLRPTVLDAKLCAGAEVANTLQTFGLISIVSVKESWLVPVYVSSLSAERYDPLTSTWASIAAMSTRRRYVRVATLGTNLRQ